MSLNIGISIWFLNNSYSSFTQLILVFLILNIIFILIILFSNIKNNSEDTNNKLKKLADLSTDPLAIIDGNNIKIANKEFYELLDFKDEGNSFSDIFKDYSQQNILMCAKNKKPLILSTKDSSYIIMPSPMSYNNSKYIKLHIYPLRDLTTFFKIYDNPFLKNVCDNLDWGIFVLDKSRNILYSNTKANSMVALKDTSNINIKKVIPFNTYNHILLKELPSIYKDRNYKSANYVKLNLNGNIKKVKFCMFPIKHDSNIVGVSIILEEKSSYIKNLEKNSISSSLQENADFGIYKYNYENKLIHLSKGASFLMFKEFVDKTISIDSFFDIVNKKDFIENYHSSNLINNPYDDKFETEASLKVLSEKNIRLKFFGIIEGKNNSSFIGDYGYIFNISSYYVPEFKDKIALATEYMDDEVFITDLSGEVIYLNKKAKKIFELNKSNASTFSVYKFHKDITTDFWYHKLIPSLSKNNSCSIILDFKNPKKYIQFKFYMIDVNKRQIIYTVGRDITEDQKFQKELKLMSNYDQLTMILNRRGIYDNMSSIFKKEYFAVVIIDLDNFKPVNDTFGHLAGDLVISTLAKRLKSSSPSNSLVGRLSGDEFIVIIPEYGHLNDLENKIKKIHKSITRKYIISQGVCTIGASIGISLYPENGQSRNELFRKADKAMYSVKKSGKNGYLIYSNLL